MTARNRDTSQGQFIPPIAAETVFTPRRSIVAVDVYKTHMVVHLSDGRQIRQAHTAAGQSVRYSAYYSGLKIEPFPYKPDRHHG